MQKLLESIAASTPDWVELRYQARRTKEIRVRNGKLEESSSKQLTGVGVRALVDGVFGFASTTDLAEDGIRRAVAEAQSSARAAASAKKQKIAGLAPGRFARGTFPVQTDDPLDNHPLEEKLALVMKTEESVRNASDAIASSMASFAEILDEKIIVNSDGSSVHLFSSIPEFRVVAVAQQDGDQTMSMDSTSVHGGWADLFGIRTPETMVEDCVQLAVDQLSAPHAIGGNYTVVLDPGLVGVLSHEAIGHTVEADIVLGGAVTLDKIGKRVASDLITMCDSGKSEHASGATGILAVDDEGIETERTVLIEQGILRSFLHNRESAAHFGVEPTGNARAYEYSDEPLVRMRNTYIEPGETPVDEMIAGVKNGLYLKGLGFGGQADSNAEFMFGVREARRIVDGKIGELVRGATLSGNAFEVLESADAVGNDFLWSLGAGTCGKGQAAKVDAGGPHIRCVATIGGRQE